MHLICFALQYIDPVIKRNIQNVCPSKATNLFGWLMVEVGNIEGQVVRVKQTVRSL